MISNFKYFYSIYCTYTKSSNAMKSDTGRTFKTYFK